MRIRLLKNMGIEGKHTPAGTVIEADDNFARHQISVDRAEEVSDDTPLGAPKKGKPAPAPAAKPAPDKDDA